MNRGGFALPFGIPPSAGGLYQPYILARSAVPISVPADVTEDTLITIPVPANALGQNGILRVTSLWTFTNNANNKTLRIRYSGGAGTQYLSAVRSTQLAEYVTTIIANRGATNSQVGNSAEATAAFNGGLSGAHVTSAADTTGATNIVITGQKASAGDVITLESYLVELLYGP